jgi:hypothetical protein
LSSAQQEYTLEIAIKREKPRVTAASFTHKTHCSLKFSFMNVRFCAVVINKLYEVKKLTLKSKKLLLAQFDILERDTLQFFDRSAQYLEMK